MKKLLCIMAALALVACGANTANAAFVLAIDDPSTAILDVVVVDDSAAGTLTQNVGNSTHADLLGLAPTTSPPTTLKTTSSIAHLWDLHTLTAHNPHTPPVR